MTRPGGNRGLARLRNQVLFAFGSAFVVQVFAALLGAEFGTRVMLFVVVSAVVFFGAGLRG